MAVGSDEGTVHARHDASNLGGKDHLQGHMGLFVNKLQNFIGSFRRTAVTAVRDRIEGSLQM